MAIPVEQSRDRLLGNIAVKRALLNKSRRINPNKRVPRWQFPHKAELFYTQSLLALVDMISQAVKKSLIPQLPLLTKEAASMKPETATDQKVKADSFLDDLNSIINNMQQSLTQAEPDATVLADTISQDVSTFNREQMQKTLKSVFGVQIFAQEPWLKDQLDIFAQQNVDLIKSISSDAFSDIKGIVQRGLATGLANREIEQGLTNRIDITKRRAKLIARDQTSKLNGQLTQLRQAEAGVEQYTWVTAGDERVRPTHAANEGMVFSWDNPPATGHPGFEINCRCTAVPVIKDLTEKAS